MSHPAKLINEASNLIVKGEYDKAIISLTNTLKTLKLVLSGDARILVPKELEDENDESDMDFSDSYSSHFESFEYDFFSSPTSSSFLKTVVAVNGRGSTRSRFTHTHDSSSDSHEGMCRDASCSCRITHSDCTNCPQHELHVSIFRDPIMVRGNHFRSPLNLRVCEELSYVAIYNLALAHHLKSVELAYSPAQQQSRRVYLQKALSLYEHSHQILMKQQRINVGTPVIHSLALVSNLSQIHHALGDHTKAEMCKQYLLSTMMYVIDCGKVDSLGNSLEGFFSIIQSLIAGDVPAAAA
mmetsp:Transcript_15021/g.34822  ORF Transcript_15021/g.34822 Transcript_15021/m.34822 type:complete len:297 (-) Transcript_15021:101-991(-)|eukprot:CAMPEP_0197183568 /NCGR_PEP_ID=MMETSP1423-20130617/7887_1 /TAXON_ID=476441 /ORGANISM="Pseudo-nitzschia heimii, Strain UNC1101" /LENGTH=296 /DNA_ID=CAMNT_0042634155 /DNA_START=98 /DNA_END=988 /DNA_ORIENTATION=+